MPDRIGAFLAAAVLVLLFPGPAVLYITARGIDQGRWAAVLSAWGVELGNLILALATAAGLSAVLVSSTIAFSVVKYAGAAYLIFLGARRIAGRDIAHRSQVRRASLRRVFGQGLLVGVSNPKTALFFAAFLPQFVNPAAGLLSLQLLVLGLMFVAIGLVTDTAYALASGTVGARVRWRGFVPAQRYLAGAVYVALGIVAALAPPSGRVRPSVAHH